MTSFYWLLVITLLALTSTSDGYETEFHELDLSLLNPITNPENCGFEKPSYICDPDNLMEKEQAEHLNFLAQDMKTSTSCICTHCSVNKNGVTVGVLIKHNITTKSFSRTNRIQKPTTAQKLRKQWKLGSCEDDIVILVIAEPPQFEFAMGATVDHLIHNSVAEQIFKDCSVHFENNNFYQGLESMIYSYRDILNRLQQSTSKQSQLTTKPTGLIVGLLSSVAVLIVLMVVAATVRYHQLSKPLMSQPHHSEVVECNNFEYKLCEDSYKEDNNSNSSDEGIDSEDDSLKLDVSRFTDNRVKRQLSAVVEESEDNSEVISLVVLDNYLKSTEHKKGTMTQ